MVGLEILVRIDPEKRDNNPVYDEKFGIGSKPAAKMKDSPPVEGVLAYMHERREALLNILEELKEEDFSKPTPEDTPPFMPDFGSVFLMIAWHEGLHAGQLSVAHRALGRPPMI